MQKLYLLYIAYIMLSLYLLKNEKIIINRRVVKFDNMRLTRKIRFLFSVIVVTFNFFFFSRKLKCPLNVFFVTFYSRY